ncbi:MAG TPA: hypothetical protein EYP62_02865 [Kiritimatiellae bacterium]|nr:hypothetical protein [Kiritimatiellia bacterium]
MRAGNPPPLSFLQTALLLWMCFAIPCARATEATARSLLEKAASALDSGRYEEAERLCLEARSQLPPGSPLRAVVEFNLGLALCKRGKNSDAEQLWTDAAHTTDLTLQAMTSYNLAHIYLEKAQAAIARKDPAAAMNLLDRAISHYRYALRATPRDLDAKINYEIALRLKEHIRREMTPPASGSAARRQKFKEKQGPTPSPGQTAQQRRVGESPPRAEQGASRSAQPYPRSQPHSRKEPEHLGPARSAAPWKALPTESARAILDAIREDEKARRSTARLIMSRPTPVEKDW